MIRLAIAISITALAGCGAREALHDYGAGGASGASITNASSSSMMGPGVTSVTVTSSVVGSSSSVTTGPTTTVTTSVTTGAGGNGSVDCGGSPCPVGMGGACCFDINMMSETCVMNAMTDCDSANGQTDIQCQTSDDCPMGEVCCGHRTGMGGPHYRHIQCDPTCMGPNRITMCDPNGPPCPSGPNGPENCQQSMLLPPGYFVCAP